MILQYLWSTNFTSVVSCKLPNSTKFSHHASSHYWIYIHSNTSHDVKSNHLRHISLRNKVFYNMVCKAIKFKIMERGYLPKVFIGSDHRVDMNMYVFCQKNFQTKRETFWISYVTTCNFGPRKSIVYCVLLSPNIAYYKKEISWN